MSRVTVLLVLGLVTLWFGALYYRMEIRAQWWAWRIRQVEEPALRAYYAACLGAVGDKSLGAVQRLLNHPDESIRLIGVRILRSCKDPRALQLLVDRLADAGIDVSEAAALQIALRPDSADALPQLRAIVEANGPATPAAMAALERIGGPQAEEILLRQLNCTGDPDVLAQAIDSLGMLGCKAAQAGIRRHMDDTRLLSRLPATQRRAQQVIVSVSGKLIAQGIDPASVAAASRTQPTVGSVAARALAAIQGGASSMPAATSSAASQEGFQ
jgi:HEAT repeat protein